VSVTSYHRRMAKGAVPLEALIPQLTYSTLLHHLHAACHQSTTIVLPIFQSASKGRRTDHASDMAIAQVARSH